MSDLDIIDEHIIIRETVGYELIGKVEICDLPSVLHFLKIINNYQRMVRLDEKNEDNFS